MAAYRSAPRANESPKERIIANLDHRPEGIPVVPQDRKGPIALAMTNEFGGFHVDFDVRTNAVILASGHLSVNKPIVSN